MPVNINTAVVNGEVSWVKVGYTKHNKTFVTFIVRQKMYKFDLGKLTETIYDSYLCQCFDETQFMHDRVKEGVRVTIQGRLSTYTDKDGKNAVIIIAEKIEVNGFGRNEK